MIGLLKYVMRIFYANNNYAKHRIEGANYLMAIIGTSFYFFLSAPLLFIIASSVFHDFYKWYLNIKVNSTIFGLLYVGNSFVFLRIVIKEKDIQENNFTKEYVEKVVNYLIAYAITLIIFIGIIGMKFLPR